LNIKEFLFAAIKTVMNTCMDIAIQIRIFVHSKSL